MSEILPSWRDAAARRSIIEFVERVSGDGAGAVPIADRVAVFDRALAAASARGYTVVSVRDDWASVFVDSLA